MLSLSSLCFATDEDICAVENFCNTLFKCIYNLHEEIFCLIVDHIERECLICVTCTIYMSIIIINLCYLFLDTPRKMYYLHTSAWVANMFALFFILAAHEHYSIDVFVAFYITSRMFLYYHTLANNRSLMIRDKKRTSIWFPLFSFFESKCDGIVPNEFEWPLPRWKKIKCFFNRVKTDIAASPKNKKKL